MAGHRHSTVSDFAGKVNIGLESDVIHYGLMETRKYVDVVGHDAKLMVVVAAPFQDPEEIKFCCFAAAPVEADVERENSAALRFMRDGFP